MKKIIFLLLIFPSVAFADQFAVENPDGSIEIVFYQGGRKSLGDVLTENGLSGLPIKKITDSDKPPREDRAFFVLSDVPGKKIAVDAQAKQAEEARKIQESQARQAVLTKLGITQEELENLKPVLR